MNSIDKLGNAIKLSRIKKGFSQEKLAEILDVTPTHIKHMESGRRKPSVEILFKLANILDISLDSLIFDTFDDRDSVIESIVIDLKKCERDKLNLIKDVIDVIVKND